MEKTPKKSLERRQITASTLQGGETCAWSVRCQGGIPPFCYSWNNAVSCRQPFLSCTCAHMALHNGRVEMCGPWVLPYPTRGRKTVCATQQTERSLLTFFFPVWTVLLGSFYCTEARFCWGSLVFKGESALCRKRRDNVSGSFEFRLP